jgi:uncharacterized RDD family membrane protein YckC
MSLASRDGIGSERAELVQPRRERRAAVAGARAGAITRLAAFVVDAAVVTAGLRGTAWLLDATARTLRRFAPPIDLGSIVLSLVPLAVGVYLATFWWLTGQTPGKWLLGIKVIPIGGGRLKFGRAALRVMGYVISALPCYLGFIWILGRQRRGWHDRIADTEVVYVTRRHEPEAPDDRTFTGLGRPATA